MDVRVRPALADERERSRHRATPFPRCLAALCSIGQAALSAAGRAWAVHAAAGRRDGGGDTRRRAGRAGDRGAGGRVRCGRRARLGDPGAHRVAAACASDAGRADAARLAARRDPPRRRQRSAAGERAFRRRGTARLPDIARSPKRNLAFGEGIHHCLGAPLARLQGRVVLEEVLEAMPKYRLDGPVELIATHNTRGVARLPVAIG
jgi:hypothetical protein